VRADRFLYLPMVKQQLPLDLYLRDSASFLNYVVGDNSEACFALESLPDPGNRHRMIWLSGSPGTGKSHLLEALCHRALEMGLSVMYLSLDSEEMRATDSATNVLDGLEQLDVICIDDIEAVAGVPHWEQALFVLCELARNSGCALAMAADKPANELSIDLPDLKTRLAGWFLGYHLKPLADAGKREALQRRAENRGLHLDEDVVQYVLNRYPRDMHALFELVERIDIASMTHRRRVTIPFLRTLE